MRFKWRSELGTIQQTPLPTPPVVETGAIIPFLPSLLEIWRRGHVPTVRGLLTRFVSSEACLPIPAPLHEIKWRREEDSNLQASVSANWLLSKELHLPTLPPLHKLAEAEDLDTPPGFSRY